MDSDTSKGKPELEFVNPSEQSLGLADLVQELKELNRNLKLLRFNLAKK